MADGKAYDDLIMDHIRNARGYHALDDATHNANGSNPLCGDEMTVYLRLDGDRIGSVSFQCACCGISMASASIMTECVKGKLVADIRTHLRNLVASLTARADPVSSGADAMQHALLKTVEQFPARTRCAALPWVTLDAALDNLPDTVFVR